MSYPPPGGQDPYQPLPGSQPEGNPYAQVPPPPPYQPPPPAYQYPMSGVPMNATPAGNNGLALGSMITGIVSVVLACCCPPIGLAGGATGVILGVIGLKQTSERGQAGRGMAIAGIATGAAGLLLAIVVMIFNFSGMFANFNNFDGTTWD